MEKQNLFPPSEYESRVKRVREESRKSGIDVLLVTSPENIYYLTGYQTFGEATQFLIVPPSGGLTFVLRELESHLVAITTFVETTETYRDSEDGIVKLAGVLSDLALDQHRLGIDLDAISATTEARMRLILKSRPIVNSTGVVEMCRMIKSELEVAACRRASSMTAKGMEAAFNAVSEGTSENHIAAVVYTAMTEDGAEWLTHDPIVTSGPRSGIPHTTYARRIVRDGDSVLLEFSGCYYRYNSPLMRTCFVGRVPQDVRRMYEVCQDGLAAAIDAIKPGTTSGEAHDACQRVVDSAGQSDNFRKRLGYAVGIGFKSWSEGAIFDLKAGDSRVIEAGMVLHLPPALRLIGQVGVGVSETVLVTETGCVPLATLDRQLVER